MRTACFALIPALVACAPAVEAPVCKPSAKVTFGRDRPVEVVVPSLYDPCAPAGLVLLLHGLGAGGALQSAFFDMPRLADEASMLFLAPDGTPMSDGTPFWNATDACCDFERIGTDDVAYLTWLVAEVSAEYNVDPKRVFLVGHSNGGFMSYRLACERADLFAGVVSLAGATWLDPARCSPSEPVSVLQIHGTLDDTVFYAHDEASGQGFPGAVETVTQWAAYDGCAGPRGPGGAAVDVDTSVAGNEGVRTRFAECPDGIDVELVTLEAGGHVPAVGQGFRVLVRDFLLGHSKQ